MVFSQNLISILLSKPDKQADMQMSFFGADPLPKTPDHQKQIVAHQNSNFFILSYASYASHCGGLWCVYVAVFGGCSVWGVQCVRDVVPITNDI